MTLTRTALETGSFTSGGSHTSTADRTTTANRLQILTASGFGESAPGAFTVSNTYDFTWDLLATLTLPTFKTVLGYTRYARAEIYVGWTAGDTGRTTVDFGTLSTSHGSTGASSLWNHYQIAGFTTPSLDNGHDVIPQDVSESAGSADATFGGVAAARLDLPGALHNAESLTFLALLVGSESVGNTTMYTTDGTKTVVNINSQYPYPSLIILRNSTNIYGYDVIAAGGEDDNYSGFAFEIMETPAVAELIAYWGLDLGTSADAL